MLKKISVKKLFIRGERKTLKRIFIFSHHFHRPETFVKKLSQVIKNKQIISFVYF